MRHRLALGRSLADEGTETVVVGLETASSHDDSTDIQHYDAAAVLFVELFLGALDRLVPERSMIVPRPREVAHSHKIYSCENSIILRC